MTPREPIGYVMSRFPKLTETFILQEILAMEQAGVDVRIYPLLREREPITQPDARRLVGRARYLPFMSLTIVATNLRWLATRPRAYLGAVLHLMHDTAGSANYLVGGLAIFPKVVQMAYEMERAGVTHVHCHFSNHPAAAGFVIHRLTAIPYSFTAHGSDLHVDRHMLPRKVREASFVVAISEDNRRVIEAACGRDAIGKVHVIHCGVDVEQFALSADRLLPATRPFTVTSIGKLHEVKGQTHLIEACRILADRGLDFSCTIVGDGPDREQLDRQVRRAGIETRVRFVGSRTSDEIRDILRATDVLVAPSVPTSSGRREGIPVVLMEAMASGVGVVASRLSGIPELVRDGTSGLLVPPGDPRAIADAVARLHDDPALRRRLVTTARDTVVRSFNVQVNAARLLERIVATSPAPARGRRETPSQPKGFTVALIGPDGAGKTTVAQKLARDLPMPASYLYMGVNPASGNHVLPTTRLVHALRRRRAPDGIVHVDRPHVPPGSAQAAPGALRSAARGLRAALRTGNRLAEEWYRQARAWLDLRRGRVVIFDRHFYSDYYASDVAARRPGLARRIHGLVLRDLYPKPDLVVYLDAPADVLLARKGEGTQESLERMRAEYREFGRTIKDFVIVDATRSPEAVAGETADAIVAFAGRNGDVGIEIGTGAGQ